MAKSLVDEVLNNLSNLENVDAVNVVAEVRGYKGARKVKLAARWPKDQFEVVVCEPEGERRIKVSTPKPGAIRRLLGAALQQQRILCVA